MVGKKEAGRTAAHLAAVGLVGCALTAVQFQAVLTALFVHGATALVVVLAVGPPLAVALLAGLGVSARPVVPLTRRARGLWGWATFVYALGTLGVLAATMLNRQVNSAGNVFLLYPAGGICYALAAALLVPGTRTRLTAAALAVALAAGGSYVSWQAVQPPTLDEWIGANGVDRALLRVGEPPAGYTLDARGASAEGFGAGYLRPGASELHLTVERIGRDTRRVDARGCPVPVGEVVHCADDGGGRQLVTYEGDYERRELRLRRSGLVHTVTVQGRPADLSAARHILSTLRPATDTELAGLLKLPMRG
ncbi:hypothetical protein AB0C95_28480 [Streptomyces caniferus]|uniref:hypothetical protein n=1 Tax=Streptomyces caniferus TaxID=285557 RepID=UPI0033E5F992